MVIELCHRQSASSALFVHRVSYQKKSQIKNEKETKIDREREKKKKPVKRKLKTELKMGQWEMGVGCLGPVCQHRHSNGS